VPQCQRSPGFNTRLDGLTPVNGVWTCPGASYGAQGCRGGETYALISDAFYRGELLAVIAGTEAEFGRQAPTGAPVLLWGEGPQHIVYNGVSEIYISRAARGDRSFDWQAPHESFHHVCTPAGVLHWTHEMLAQLWTSEYLRRAGKAAYVQEAEQQELSTANLCPMEVLFGRPTIPYPPGFYGRALEIGTKLQALVGWDQLTRLADYFDSNGSPNVEAWRLTLGRHAGEVATILTP
jgi:hypothetical protein